MSDVSIDASELGALAADLTAAGSGVAAEARAIVHKGAGNIKRQLRAEMGASDAFKGAARSIDYTMHGGMIFGVGVIEAEIGPRSGPGQPGALANVAYFGGSNGGGGTVPDPKRALEAEAPKFEQAMAALVDRLLR